MITKDAAIQAIKSLCLDDGEIAQRIWSSDAIDAVRKIPESGGWISCEDRLPEIGAKCLVYANGGITTAKHIAQNDWIMPVFFPQPTHWMPLPEPPKELGI